MVIDSPRSYKLAQHSKKGEHSRKGVMEKTREFSEIKKECPQTVEREIDQHKKIIRKKED
jgi:hypothetical protein